MGEPTIVENKKRNKVPPPRPPPPASLRKEGTPPADPIPRSHTVSGDRPSRPKHPPAYLAHRGGSPALEKKSAGDPVPPPRRRKKQRSIFPEYNPNSDVKEGFVDTKHDPIALTNNDHMADRDDDRLDESAARPSSTSGVRQSTLKRKEVQKLAKIKGILVQDIDSGAPCLKCDEKCSGFSLHVWRNRCNNCECPRSDHKITGAAQVDIPYLSHLSFGHVPIESSSPALSQLEWYPPDLTDEQVMMYMSHLPKEMVPKRSGKGATYRNQQYLLQLCDSNKTVVTNLNEKETGRWKRFYEKLMFSACGVGKVVVHTLDGKRKVCFNCFQPIENGDVYVTTPDQLGDASAWHPQCFKCTTCQEFLVDLVYFFSEQKQNIYCGRHQAEQLIPRCAACDQLIFNDSFTKAKGKTWHKEHFCCWECDEELHGKSYIEENKRFYCTLCYDKLFANVCNVCNKTISVGQPQVTKNDKYWHGDCYCCTNCKKKLMGQTVFTRGTEMVCESCATGGKMMACKACHGRIQPTDKYLGKDNEFWHYKCFNCLMCNLSLVDQPFMRHQGDPICRQCYDSQCSERCTTCKQPIGTHGVKYKDKPYHSKCFVCIGCSKQLAGVSFITHNNQPYCKECHLENFAKICAVCNQSIVGKCTTYADNNYHANCFRCTKCSKPIPSTTFYEDNHGNILCSHCAEK